MQILPLNSFWLLKKYYKYDIINIGTHAMIITRAPEDYRNEDEVLYLSGHTNFRMDESFRDILEDMNTNTVFRFYNFHDIKG